MYWNSDDKEIVEEGLENVKCILRDNYVRPDEAQAYGIYRKVGRATDECD